MARWIASAKWGEAPALDGQCATLLALRLSEGLGSTGEWLLQLCEFMALSLEAPGRAGKSNRGILRLRRPQRPCMALLRPAAGHCPKSLATVVNPPPLPTLSEATAAPVAADRRTD